MLARPGTMATVAPDSCPSSCGARDASSLPSSDGGSSLIPRLWSMAPHQNGQLSHSGASRPGSQDSTRFFNISRAGTPHSSYSPTSSQAVAGSRPLTSSQSFRSWEVGKRGSISERGPTTERLARRSLPSRAGLRTAVGPEKTRKSSEPFRYLRRRAASPATMRHNQIKDDLALLMKKHRQDIEKSQAKRERSQKAMQDKVPLEIQHQATADASCDAALLHETHHRSTPDAVVEKPVPQQENGMLRHLRAQPPEICRERGRLMENLSDSMESSFLKSLDKIRGKKDPLQQRLVNKQAAEAERSQLLRILAALRGQRHQLVCALDAEEVKRLERNEERAICAPVQDFRMETRWGEMAAGEKVLHTGDEDSWMSASLVSKRHLLSELSRKCGSLSEYMPTLADIKKQHAQLVQEKEDLNEILSVRNFHLSVPCLPCIRQHSAADACEIHQELLKTQRDKFETGLLQGHAEKLMMERDTLRHAWDGGSTINSSEWYQGDDFWQSGEVKDDCTRKSNLPFKIRYPEPPHADIHAGETKALARQGLLRFELAGILRSDSTRGLVPNLSEVLSPRAAPHLSNVISCLSAAEKQRMMHGLWPGAHRNLRGKYYLDINTGQLVNSSMTLAHSSVASNFQTAMLNSQGRDQAHNTRTSTLSSGSTLHPVNCCCLACSLRLSGENPKTETETRMLYHRLSTHEAGNALNFVRTGYDVLHGSPARDSHGVADSTCQFGATAGSWHPQVPHGFRSPPRSKLATFARCIEIKQPRINDVELATAIRGGPAASLRFSAKVQGLVERVD